MEINHDQLEAVRLLRKGAAGSGICSATRAAKGSQMFLP